MLSLLGVHYHFRMTSVHYVKSTKQIMAGVRPPLPPFWQCQDFESAYFRNPKFTKCCRVVSPLRLFWLWLLFHKILPFHLLLSSAAQEKHSDYIVCKLFIRLPFHKLCLSASTTCFKFSTFEKTFLCFRKI